MNLVVGSSTTDETGRAEALRKKAGGSELCAVEGRGTWIIVG